MWGIQNTSNGKWWTGESWSDKPEEAATFEDQRAAEAEFSPDKIHPSALTSRLVKAAKLPKPKEPKEPKDE
jgi:hypothetical protein